MPKRKTRGNVSAVARRNAALQELIDLLRQEACTARGIAEKLGMTKPTAYARVAALALDGHPIQKKYVREGLHGPLAVAYSIAA